MRIVARTGGDGRTLGIDREAEVQERETRGLFIRSCIAYVLILCFSASRTVNCIHLV